MTAKEIWQGLINSGFYQESKVKKFLTDKNIKERSEKEALALLEGYQCGHKLGYAQSVAPLFWEGFACGKTDGENKAASDLMSCS